MSNNIDKNKKSEILTDLKSLGLSEKEIEVYIALLGLGEVGSSKIVKKTGLHGQFVYNALGSLEEKGLVGHIIKRGRKKFNAKNPRVLERLAEHQKRIAQSVAEKLNQIMVLPAEQEYEVFQGKESYIAHEFELLEKADENSELLIIGGSGDEFIAHMKDEFKRYEKIRRNKKIRIKYLGSEDQLEYLKDNAKSRDFFEYKVLPGLFTGMVNTNIWQGFIAFNIFGEPVTSFVVLNPIIASSYKQFFETLWRLAKK
ncbi:MAG: HTH-type transcriptional regulator, sugar sensing transcriptional regulator [Patescibacteria group bacterium]|nr:HTH-type transcriptional regulator, sugar sensing transcriptional regulator [Patescibacteria group bacterium]